MIEVYTLWIQIKWLDNNNAFPSFVKLENSLLLFASRAGVATATVRDLKTPVAEMLQK